MEAEGTLVLLTKMLSPTTPIFIVVDSHNSTDNTKATIYGYKTVVLGMPPTTSPILLLLPDLNHYTHIVTDGSWDKAQKITDELLCHDDSMKT